MVAGVSANGWTQRIMEGEPLGTFYTYEWAGVDSEGVSVYYTRDENGNRDGKTTRETRRRYTEDGPRCYSSEHFRAYQPLSRA